MESLKYVIVMKSSTEVFMAWCSVKAQGLLFM